MKFKSLEIVSNALNEAKNEIETDLENVVIKLIQLVNDGEVLGFGFNSNTNKSGKTTTIAYTTENTSCSIDEKPRLILDIKLKGNQQLSFGRVNYENVEYSHTSGFGRATITEETKKDLNIISEYVFFTNSHLANLLPKIDNYTNYSKKALQPNVIRAEPLLPNFLEHLIPKVEIKKYPKGFKH